MGTNQDTDQAATKDGRATPFPLRLDPVDRAFIKAEADERERSMNWVISSLVRQARIKKEAQP